MLSSASSTHMENVANETIFAATGNLLMNRSYTYHSAIFIPPLSLPWFLFPPALLVEFPSLVS